MNNLVRFGPFSVDLAARHICRDGAKIAIQGQPFHILDILLRNPGAIVSRHSLAAEIWPTGTFVDFEHSLNTAVKKLRKALGDNPDQPIYIETVPRYGYRFIGKVADTASLPAAVPVTKPAAKIPPAKVTAEQASAVRHYWQQFTKLDIVALAAAFIVLVLAASWRQPESYRAGASAKPITSVAILPFQNLTGDSGEDYLADGMTDALIANVSQFQNLSVVSRGSVSGYKGTHKPLSEIMRELKVDAVVVGSLTQSDGVFGLGAQLVRAGSDSPLWAGKYQGKLGNLMRLQSDVSLALAKQVHAALPVSSARSKNSSGDSHGYENYLRGRYFLNKRSEDDLRKAESYFTQSISEDSNLAPAYAGLADCYTLEVMYGILSRTSGTEKAQSTARRALELDDNLSEAHTALGGVYASYLWDWKSAEHEFQRAIQMNPSDAAAHHWYAVFVLAPLGRLDEALVEMQSAHELDPLSAIMETDLGFIYYLRGQYTDASKAYEQALEINPDFVPAHFRLGELDFQVGKLDDAVYESVTDVRLAGRMTPGLEEALRRAQTAYRSSGYPAFVREMVKYEHEKSVVSEHNCNEALEDLVLGQRDLALTEFAAAADARDPGMLYVAVDPSLKSVRSDPRFKDVLRRMGLLSE